MTDFVNLRVHTVKSIKESTLKTEELIARAKELGQKTVAITDRNNLYGAYDFMKQAEENGLQAIVGCDINVSPNDSIILLCKDTQGYNNLMKLVSYANTEGMQNGTPCISMEALRQYHEGLVCLSGSEAENLIRQKKYNEVLAKVEEYKQIFGDDFYIELQCYNGEDKNELAKVNLLKRLAGKVEVETVATSDCRYKTINDSEPYHYLNCIREKKNEAEENFEDNSRYIKSAEELPSVLQSAVANTVAIADKCSPIQLDRSVKIPHFYTGSERDNAYSLRSKAVHGLVNRYGRDIVRNEEFVNRLEMELSVIHDKQFDDYFLIVGDFVNFAKNNDIAIGLGRGSGAGSLVAYCLGITDVDPMEHNLLFERFLNPERTSMPDFDIDISKRDKPKVIDYVKQKYGADKVCNFSAFNGFKAKNTVNALRDTMEVKGSEKSRSYVATIDRIQGYLKKLPNADEYKKFSTILEDRTKDTQGLRNLYDTDKMAKQIIDLALKFEGLPENVSTHPAGVIIANAPVKNYAPFRDGHTAQFTSEALEGMGLLKMDFLSLKYLDVIRDTVEMIRKTNPDFDMKKISMDYNNDDRARATYEMLGRGDTTGVFQLSGFGMTNLVKDMKPKTIDDVISAISLHRPPTIPYEQEYLRNKKAGTYECVDPAVKPFVKDTHGIILYQEQVMEIFRELAGYSYGEADEVRRGISKKKPEVLKQQHDKFVSGAMEKSGLSEQSAEDIFNLLKDFSSYSFNKSHAVAYAYTAYQTAFLKANYRELYMTALIANTDDKDKREEYQKDFIAKDIGTFLSYDINSSGVGYSTSDHSLYFGLDKIIPAPVAQQVVYERERHGEFSDMADYCERVQGEACSLKNVKKLIEEGAFDSCGQDRKLLSDNASELVEAVQTVKSYQSNFSKQTEFDLD